jgi:ABC-type nitrate/sulfonate/bicarbonate transport system permease component
LKAIRRSDHIFQNRNWLRTDRVFAGLAALIGIGLVVELSSSIPSSA